jgi:NTP pyrophosphatase (non-canonical NTP hydrolase)
LNNNKAVGGKDACNQSRCRGRFRQRDPPLSAPRHVVPALFPSDMSPWSGQCRAGIKINYELEARGTPDVRRFVSASGPYLNTNRLLQAARSCGTVGDTPSRQPIDRSPMKEDSLERISRELRQFAEDRDWVQFHSPKNLAMALSAECGELLEHFMWLTGEESALLSPEQSNAVELELADIMIYVIRLADRLDVNLLAAVRRKMEINAQRYPVDKARGRAVKYDKL